MHKNRKGSNIADEITNNTQVTIHNPYNKVRHNIPFAILVVVASGLTTTMSLDFYKSEGKTPISGLQAECTFHLSSFS